MTMGALLENSTMFGTSQSNGSQASGRPVVRVLRKPIDEEGRVPVFTGTTSASIGDDLTLGECWDKVEIGRAIPIPPEVLQEVAAALMVDDFPGSISDLIGHNPRRKLMRLRRMVAGQSVVTPDVREVSEVKVQNVLRRVLWVFRRTAQAAFVVCVGFALTTALGKLNWLPVSAWLSGCIGWGVASVLLMEYRGVHHGR